MGLKAFVCLILLSSVVILDAADPVDLSVPQGFPVTWGGDAYNDTNCEIVTQLPSFLDGYFFCETAGSYGDQSNPLGQKLIHMFDGISGVAKFDLNPVQSTFSGAYYPTQSYKIWDLYGRDMTQSQVAWTTSFSPWNTSQQTQFKNILNGADYYQGQPSVDFWKIGTTIVTGTEAYDLGLEFDVPTLTDFKMYPFIETNSYFGPDSDHSYKAIHMAIHERTDLATGLLWNSVFAVKTNTSGKIPTYNLHELVFTVDPEGHRSIVGDYQYGFDERKCNYTTGVYSGDSTVLPGYMHSTTSTKNFFIMPLTSMVFNPCIFSPNYPRPPPNKDEIWDPADPSRADWTAYKLNLDVKQRFLLYDKRDKSFRMIVHTYPHFVTHQFNAYEYNDTTLYVDMVAYDDKDYSGLYLSHMMSFTSDTKQEGSHLYRFTIDLTTNTSSNASLVPMDMDNRGIEFPQFNHHFEGLKYRYSYVLLNGYVKNSSLIKIDMDDPTGKGNILWNAGFDVSLAEPYFVANTDGDLTKEDDGVVIVRGLDVSINKTRLYVLNAVTMTKIAEIIAPDVVPFGFHNRYYSKADLNITGTPTPPPPTSSAGKVTQTAAITVFSMLILLFFRFS